MRLSLRQLEVFDAVATHGGVTRAAEILCMSQAAASAALRDLQSALDRPPLFRRVGRSLQITPEGLRLHAMVRNILRDIDEISRPADRAELSGTINIGTTPTGNYMLPRVAAAFRTRHPRVLINISVGHPREMTVKLRTLELEAVVLDNMNREPGGQLVELFRERSILVAAPGHWLTHIAKPGFDDLAKAEWCLPDRVSNANLRLMDALRGRIANLSVAMEVNNDEGLREAVKAGGGIGCLPTGILDDDLASGRLIEIKVEGFEVLRPVYLARLANLKRSAAATAFDEFLIAACAPI